MHNDPEKSDNDPGKGTMTQKRHNDLGKGTTTQKNAQ